MRAQVTDEHGAERSGERRGRDRPFARLKRLFRRNRSIVPEAARSIDAAPTPWLRAYPPGLDWRAPIAERPLPEILDEIALTLPEKACLNFFGRAQSYREVARLVDRAAAGFRALGVDKGVNVGLILPNTPHYVICYYAVLKAGGTVVNYNPLYAEAEIARQARDSHTRIMVTLDLVSIYPKLVKVLDETPIETVVTCSMLEVLPLRQRALFALLRRSEVAQVPNDERHVRFAALIAHAPIEAPTPIDPQRDIAVLQYTGGTTGEPKGAMLTHAALSANAAQAHLWFPSQRAGEERILGVLPLFHVFGMTVVMNAGLLIGAELILLPRFKIDGMLKAIAKHRPTLFPGVPTIYAMINEHDGLERYDLSSITYCLSGGAPLPVAVKRRFEASTGCALVEGYGLSEAAPVVTCNPFAGTNKAGSAGLPLPGTMVEIVSLENRDRLLPVGETGEVCVRGPQLMTGYWQRPDEDAFTIRHGRLHTGDIGYLDDEGYLHLVGRLKELILVGGYNVYPRVVEEAIMSHPAVAEAAVCGVPDERFGEGIRAYVCLRPGETLSAGSMRAYLKDKIASFEMPRRFVFRDSLPKTDVGKIAKRVLLEEDGILERDGE